MDITVAQKDLETILSANQILKSNLKSRKCSLTFSQYYTLVITSNTVNLDYVKLSVT